MMCGAFAANSDSGVDESDDELANAHSEPPSGGDIQKRKQLTNEDQGVNVKIEAFSLSFREPSATTEP